jgi:L-alanine-DL-glutamate epimerase-like enolase superfamily enzyme
MLMKIRDIELVNVNIPVAASNLPKAVGRNYGCYMLVRVKCDNGMEGVSDAYYGNSSSAIAAVIKDALAPELIGQDPTNVAGLYERMYRAGFYSGRMGIYFYALSAVEIALWDITGKHYGAPVHALLGGVAKRTVAPYATLRAIIKEEEDDTVPAYASMQTFETPEEVGMIARLAKNVGFKSVKLHQVDIESVRAAREAVGDDVEVTMDVNGFFNPLDAVNFSKQLAKYNVGWFEEPIWPPDDYRALSQLRQRSTVPIASGENESTIYGFERLFEADCVDIIQPEVLVTGGILESVRVFSLAQARNIPIAPHNFKFGPVLAATIHLSLLFSSVITMETPWFKLEADICKVGPTINNGRAKLSGKPGLGIEIDEDVVKEYRIEKFPRK